MEQSIGLLFIYIALLLASIGMLEKNYMFGIDKHLDKLNEKHNVKVDKATYCKFEGIQRLKSVVGLLILNVIYVLFEIKDFKTTITTLVIYGIIDVILYYIRKNKFINTLKLQF